MSSVAGQSGNLQNLHVKRFTAGNDSLLGLLLSGQRSASDFYDHVTTISADLTERRQQFTTEWWLSFELLMLLTLITFWSSDTITHRQWWQSKRVLGWWWSTTVEHWNDRRWQQCDCTLSEVVQLTSSEGNLEKTNRTHRLRVEAERSDTHETDRQTDRQTHASTHPS